MFIDRTTGEDRNGAGRAGRISAYDAFLSPVREERKDQLTIVTDAHVERVVFDAAGKTAVPAPVQHMRHQNSPISACLLGLSHICVIIITEVH